MNVSITIDKDNIFKQIYRITGYTGKKEGNIDKLASTEDDATLLTSYYNESLGKLSELIANYGSISSDKVNLVLPANWKSVLQSSLSSNIENYIINYVCLKWMAITKNDMVTYYDKTLDSISTNIIKLMSERTKPTR